MNSILPPTVVNRVKPTIRSLAGHCLAILLFLAILASNTHAATGISKIYATKEKIILLGKNEKDSLSLVELEPFDSITNAPSRPPLARISRQGSFKISLPRFDGERDRIYSAFAAVKENQATGEKRFVEEWKSVSKFNEPYPKSPSKKGLQVQMVDDAIALGVKHAALNVNFGNMVLLDGTTNDVAWRTDGRTFYFRRGFVENYDRQIKTLSDAGMTVTLILLNYEGGDTALNKVLLHPNYENSPEKLSAFNTSTAEGLAWFKACMEFLAHRYSEPGYPHGRAVNYIVGNEVNSHKAWANMGPVTMEQFADDYLRTVRICHAAVRKFSSTSRVFISLEHHWNMRWPGGNEKQAFEGRRFVDYFNQRAKAGGDFDWHVAFHPYPEDLFECRTWNDKTATFTDDTPRITFKNLEMLPSYFQRKELLYDGKPRRIILSEQGFHSPVGAEGELWQAAAYCYAYYKIANIKGIDSFILHRHVDHGAEYGLRLGLWRRNEKNGSMADPESKKPIYEVFRLADTPNWKKSFEFALPVIGIKSWKELNP